MADIDDVVTALVTRIKTGMSGTALGGRVFAYSVDSPVPPCAIVLPDDGDFLAYDSTMDGSDDFDLQVKLLVAAEISRTATAQLLGYLSRSGSSSLRAAIYGDKTLGGTVSDLKVTGARSFGDVEWAGVVYYGADVLVSVYS